MKSMAFTAIFLAAAYICPAQAQVGGAIGPVSPCVAFGTTAGTCFQGNGLASPPAIGTGTPAAITGTTITANTSLTVNGGAAITTLNQGTDSPCVITDASGAALSMVGSSCVWTQVGKAIFGNFYVTYPTTADGSNATLAMGLTASLNSASSRGGAVLVWTDAATVTQAFLLENTANVRLYVAGGTQATNSTMSGKTVTVMFNYQTN